MTDVTKITLSDLPQIAEIHTQVFPNSALTSLGEAPLKRYYEWLLTGPHDAVCLKAVMDDVVVGFCFGGIFRGAVGGFLQKNKGYLFYHVITHPWLIANPLFRNRLLLGINVLRRWTFQNKLTNSNSEKPRTSFGILSIATHPDFQGCGIGKLLITTSEKIAIERGFSMMNLTVHPENMKSIKFYERIGWEKSFNHNHEWQGTMIKHLVSADNT